MLSFGKGDTIDLYLHYYSPKSHFYIYFMYLVHLPSVIIWLMWTNGTVFDRYVIYVSSSFVYCNDLVNVNNYFMSQSDHIKQLPLYLTVWFLLVIIFSFFLQWKISLVILHQKGLTEVRVASQEFKLQLF